mgnify:FL=1
MTIMINQMPPVNIEAEEAVLGGIFLDSEAIVRVRNILIPEAFYVIAHQCIYDGALQLHNQGKPTDLLTVTDWLVNHDFLTRIGGKNKLASLVESTVSAVNIDLLAELLMDKYRRRQIIKAGNEIVELGYQKAMELSEILDSSEQKIFQISNQRLSSNIEHNSKIARDAYNEIHNTSPIYPTGFNNLDNFIVGFEPGTLTIIAGRPSMGKSAISLCLGLQMITRYKLPVIFFSLEMTKKQLEYRLWSLISITPEYKQLHFIPIESDRIRKHRASLEKLSDREINNIDNVINIASELPLYISDRRGISVSDIASECRQIQAKEGKIGLVIIDYLQMMAEDSTGNRSYELGDVARELYKMAGNLEVPLLALSQVNRAVEGRNTKRPMMSDLSQSGILEMVADNIILAYRDEYYNPNTLNNKVLELIVAKSRHGDTGTATVIFDKRYGAMVPLAPI